MFNGFYEFVPEIFRKRPRPEKAEFQLNDAEKIHDFYAFLVGVTSEEGRIRFVKFLTEQSMICTKNAVAEYREGKINKGQYFDGMREAFEELAALMDKAPTKEKETALRLSQLREKVIHILEERERRRA